MSYVMNGIPSTGFALLIDDQPFLLIDCGAGIALSYQKIIGEIYPSLLFITHNHLDHAGDLPILSVYIRKKQGVMPSILGHKDVLKIVQTHRFHELCTKEETPDQKANWHPIDTGATYQLDHGLSLQLLPCKHSYLCYGFILYRDGNPILAYSADSAFQEDVYTKMSVAPTIIVDGREVNPSGEEHASFEQIESFFGGYSSNSVYIVHYESTSYQSLFEHIQFMKTGQKILL